MNRTSNSSIHDIEIDQIRPLIDAVKARQMGGVIIKNLTADDLRYLARSQLYYLKKEEWFMFHMLKFGMPIMFTILISGFVPLVLLIVSLNNRMTVAESQMDKKAESSTVPTTSEMNVMSAQIRFMVDDISSIKSKLCGCFGDTHTVIGPRGPGILSGTTDPDSSVGQIGDFYINLQTQKIFGPRSNIWSSGFTLGFPGQIGLTGATGDKGDKGDKGDAGIRGSLIITGDKDPDSTVGHIGDVYINLLNQSLWGPKTNIWDIGIILGFNGRQGERGEIGVKGDYGLTGKDGVCPSNCFNGLTDDCCGSTCARCQPGFVCRSGGCFIPSNNLVLINSVYYNMLSGQFSYTACNLMCSTILNGNKTMVMTSFYEESSFLRFLQQFSGSDVWLGFKRDTSGVYSYMGQLMLYTFRQSLNSILDCMRSISFDGSWYSTDCKSLNKCSCMT